jgi:hypothetical protein
MEPSNQQERKKAFWNFLLFFCITVGVIVVTMLFSFQVPFKERDMLRKKADISDNHKVQVLDFGKTMREAMNMIDTLDQVKNAFLVEGRIKANIQTLSDIAARDTTWMKDMLRDAVYNLTSLTEAKMSLLKVADAKAELDKKDERIEKLTEKLEECKDKLSRPQVPQ